MSQRGRVGEAAEDQEEGVPFPAQIAQEPASQYGHRYGDIGIDDNARVQVGDSIHHYYNGPQPQADQYKILLTSLTFDRMDARLRNVAVALPTSCEWLVRHDQFVEWTDISKNHEHQGFLWIKGKPGSGKSTIMKETLAWAERHWSSQITLSYFFNARSPHQLEKSSLGLYRSLLYQLLCALPSGRNLFVKRFASKVRNDTVEDWTEIELQNFLIELITTLQLPIINIFIDALDEGSDDDVRRMVKFLERLTWHTTAAARLLRICLSSRHYPHISVEKCVSLILEDQVEHNQDIEAYVRSELVGGNSPQMDDLQRQVRDRSTGVFLWVALVVPMLNKAYDKGMSSVAMLRKLEEIPPDLQDLFTQILSKDLEDLDECITLLEWVLFSMRPLSAAELYHAVQQACLTAVIDKSIVLTQETLARHVLNCSRGLVELTGTESPVVQFIHETVRGYLLGQNMFGPRLSGIYVSHTSIPVFQADVCHRKISESCLQYLLDVCDQAPLNEDILKQYPLAQYTAEYWWQHVQMSKSLCSPEFLESAWRLLSGCSTNLWTWVQLYDVDERYRPLFLSLTVEDLAPPLYYAAFVGITQLVSLVLLRGADVNAQGGIYGNALIAASARGHKQVVRMLLDKGADVNAQVRFHGNALIVAAVGGHEQVVQMLLDKGADVDAGGIHGNALISASEGGHEQVVRMLINKGADVNAQGEFHGNALIAASVGGHQQVVRILLDKGAGVNTQRGYYSNALIVAAVGGHEQVVQMLIDKGADVNARGMYGNALMAASEGGHEQVIRMLLDKGADVNVQGGEYGNALIAASVGGYEQVVRMLLDKGADVNAQGEVYGNALQAASEGGHEQVVRMLLDKGADVNAQGEFCGSALIAASEGGHEQVVRVLLDNGADVNAQGGSYGNALQAASVWGHERVAQMLLDKGADVNAEGGCYDNALQAA